MTQINWTRTPFNLQAQFSQWREPGKSKHGLRTRNDQGQSDSFMICFVIEN